jgi:hypothetical protein
MEAPCAPADNRCMRRFVAGGLLILALAPSFARADSPLFVDSLVPRVFPIPREAHERVFRALLGPTRPDSLAEWPRTVVLSNLYDVEVACRTKLFSKEMEPGSPWIEWRSLGRIDAGDVAWYVAALSCTDAVCAEERVLHDRLALLAIDRDRSRLILLPPQAATIGDPGTEAVDSLASIRAGDHALVQVRRRVRSGHPCFDGGDRVDDDEHHFLVLRGDSLAQCFVLIPRDEWGSHDDVDGDSATERRGTIVMTATSVRMDYQIEERQYSPDGDESKTRTKITKRGVVRLAYDRRSGRFVRLE